MYLPIHITGRKKGVTISIVGFFILFNITRCFAQDISTNSLVWQAVEATNLQSGVTTTLSCQFKTNLNRTVEWIQKKGESVTLFSITSVEGGWRNVSSNGFITYNLLHNGVPCKMTIVRSRSGAFITMDFSRQNDLSVFRFKITSVK